MGGVVECNNGHRGKKDKRIKDRYRFGHKKSDNRQTNSSARLVHYSLTTLKSLKLKTELFNRD